MSNILQKIQEFGQKNDLNSLQEFMAAAEENELLNAIKEKLSILNFDKTWNYILKSFTDQNDSHKKRLKVVLTVFRELEKCSLSAVQIDVIFTRLITDLNSFKSEHLVDLCTYCMECIQLGRLASTSYKKLLPSLLNVLINRENLEYNSVEMTGAEFKTQFVNSLYMLEWSPNIVIVLTVMFIDMPLTTDEHLQAVKKLSGYIEKLTPQEIPVFVYQLLKLCKFKHSRVVFFKLESYFRSILYNMDNAVSDSNSENTDDIIENASNEEIFEAESTVLFHINRAASLCQGNITDYLACLKILLKAPEYVLDPFQLTVLLSIFNVNHFEDQITDILKSGISRILHEEQRKNNSLWLKGMVPNLPTLESILNKIIELSVKGRNLVIDGLIKLSFVLLNVGSALGRDLIAEKQWQLGTHILLKVVKRKRNNAPFVMQTLNNNIVTGSNVTHYIDCLYLLSKKMTLLMLENQSYVIKLMENLLKVPGPVASQLLSVIIPLTKLSPTIRDHLILLLRKALYSRCMETRRMAVTGFIVLLKYLKISDLTVLSQSSSSSFSSGHSVLTQISLNTQTTHNTQNISSAFSNEALCLEVLNILKRCFMQQAEVRSQFYDGLHETVYMNPDLGLIVLNVIWMHFHEFYISDEDSLPPIKFSKLSVTKDLDVILQEPIGKLIYTVSLIVIKMINEEKENDENVKRFIDILESLCARMMLCELIHFELDDGSDLTDNTPESQHKLLTLIQALTVYEALIGYKFFCWCSTSENNGHQINQLFQGYFRLVNMYKNLSKSKKDIKKKKAENKTTQQTDITIRKDNKHLKQIKLPDTVLSIQVIEKALNLLHRVEVSWATMVQANIIKTKPEIHRHIMQATVHLIQTSKSKHTVDTETTKQFYKHCTEIGSVLYERCIERLNEFCDFDSVTAILAAECFHIILNVICTQYKNNLVLFLSTVAREKTNEKDLGNYVKSFIETYKNLFETMKQNDEDDPNVKKLAGVVLNTLVLLCNQIPVESTSVASQMIDWLNAFIAEKTISNKQISSIFITLLFDIYIKYKNNTILFENVAKKIAAVIGTTEEEEHNVEEMTFINELTVNNILQSLCASIKSLLDDVDWMIVRLKSESIAIDYIGNENLEGRNERLKIREKGVCCQLHLLIIILKMVTNLTVQPGPASEIILKNLTHLYVTLNSLAKYFIQRSSKTNPIFQTARFEHLIKLVGKELNPSFYKLIMYIQESQLKNTETSQQTKKTVNCEALKSKVLKETRIIPKIVYEIEMFSKSVIQLSNKTKINLSKYVGQGISRDYRISHLKEILQDVNDGSTCTQESNVTDDNTGLDASIEISGDREDIAVSEGESDTTQPPPKRSKK